MHTRMIILPGSQRNRYPPAAGTTIDGLQHPRRCPNHIIERYCLRSRGLHRTIPHPSPDTTPIYVKCSSILTSAVQHRTLRSSIAERASNNSLALVVFIFALLLHTFLPFISLYGFEGQVRLIWLLCIYQFICYIDTHYAFNCREVSSHMYC